LNLGLEIWGLGLEKNSKSQNSSPKSQEEEKKRCSSFVLSDNIHSHFFPLNLGLEIWGLGLINVNGYRTFMNKFAKKTNFYKSVIRNPTKPVGSKQ